MVRRTLARLAPLSLAFVAATVVVGCRDGSEGGPTPAATPPGATVPGERGAATALSLVRGRLIAVVDQDTGRGASVLSIDPGSGAQTDLWTLTEDAPLPAWQVSPDGGKASYAVSRAESDDAAAAQELYVRELVPEAQKVVAAVATDDQWRVSGYSWSPDGEAIAFVERPTVDLEAAPDDYPGPRAYVHRSERGTRAYPGPGPTPLQAYVVRIGPSGATPTRRQLPIEGRSLLSLAHEPSGPQAEPKLVAWSPETQRMAFVEASVDGGPAGGVAVVDTTTGRVARRLALATRAEDVAGSADGRFLAVASSVGARRRIWILALASGEVRALVDVGADRVPASPVWSPDSRWLAWTEYPDPGVSLAEPMARVQLLGLGSGTRSMASAVDATDRSAPRSLALADRNLYAVAFSPDSQALLVAESGPNDPVWDRVSVYAVSDLRRWEPAWRLPPGTWRLSWVQ